jgi:hypothetical protein
LLETLINGARFLGEEARIGSIAVGKHGLLPKTILNSYNSPV